MATSTKISTKARVPAVDTCPKYTELVQPPNGRQARLALQHARAGRHYVK